MCALLCVGANTHRGTHDESTVGVLGRQGVLVGLDEVLDGEEASESTVGVNEGELLDLVRREDAQRFLGIDTHRSGDERHRRHHLVHPTAHIVFEPHIAIGDDAEEHLALVDDRHAAHPITGAEGVDLRQRVVGAAGHRIAHHACLGALDHVDLRGLILNREIAMQDSHAALAGHGDGHACLGDRVHRA